MATKNQTGLGVSVDFDIKQLRKGLSEATKHIKTFTNQLETMKIDPDILDSETIENFEESFDKARENIKKSLAEVKEALEQTKLAQAANADSAANYDNDIATLTKTISDYELKLAKLSKQEQEYKVILESISEEAQEFNKNLKDTDTELDNIRLEFSRTVSSMEDWETTTEGLTAKLQELNETKRLQEQRLKLLQERYEKISNEFGETSDVAKKLRDEITKQYGEIYKTNNQTKKYTDSLNDNKRKVEELRNKIDKLNVELKDTQSKFGKNSTEAKQLKSNLKNLTSQCSKLEAEMDDVNKKTEKTSGGFTIFKGALANLVSDGIQTAVRKLGELAKSVYTVGASFEQEFQGKLLCPLY